MAFEFGCFLFFIFHTLFFYFLFICISHFFYLLQSVIFLHLHLILCYLICTIHQVSNITRDREIESENGNESEINSFFPTLEQILQVGPKSLF